MKRLGLIACVAMVAAVGAGCIPAASPPPLYQAPVIDQMRVDPDPAVAGAPVTISLDVIDDEIVSDVAIHRLVVPTGVVLPGPNPCASEIVQGPVAGHATVDITCDLPPYALNGRWELDLTIYDRAQSGFAYVGLRTQISFDVAGGNEDRSAPQMVSWQTTPSEVRNDAPFTLTMQLIDESPLIHPVSANYGFFKFGTPSSAFNCERPVLTPVSATETTLTTTCSPSNYYVAGTSELGWHIGRIPVTDALGNAGQYELWVDVR